ncbi:MAG: DUF4406 domain-containing protein [Bacilli bacterium]
MVKIFISQPMNGLTNEEILKERNMAIKEITADVNALGQDVEIIDSYFKDYSPQTGSIPLKYLSRSLELLADADLLLCIGDWENARGCKIEHDCAKAYGIDISYYGYQ